MSKAGAPCLDFLCSTYKQPQPWLLLGWRLCYTEHSLKHQQINTGAASTEVRAQPLTSRCMLQKEACWTKAAGVAVLDAAIGLRRPFSVILQSHHGVQ